MKKLCIEIATILLTTLLEIVTGEGLKLCSEEVDVTQICKKSNEFRPNSIPAPLPIPLNLTVDLKNIIKIDDENNLMTVYIYIVTEWLDPNLSLAIPNGTK